MKTKNVYVIKKNINGQEIKLEVCDEGEYTTVNPKCYEKVTKALTDDLESKDGDLK